MHLMTSVNLLHMIWRFLDIIWNNYVHMHVLKFSNIGIEKKKKMHPNFYRLTSFDICASFDTFNALISVSVLLTKYIQQKHCQLVIVPVSVVRDE